MQLLPGFGALSALVRDVDIINIFSILFHFQSVIVKGNEDVSSVYSPGIIQIIALELLNTFWSAQETNGKTKTTLVTELSRGGVVTWLQNPRSLEDRNSLAKLLFQADCKDPLLPSARCTCLELSTHTCVLLFIYLFIYLFFHLYTYSGV